MTTTPETFAKQLPLALVALGTHMSEHQLPPFWSLDTRGRDVIVLLHRGTDAVWLATVGDVLAERSEHRSPGGVDVLRCEWDVTLPDTGLRFTLVAYQMEPAPVLVTA